jgi:hypothetical protein
MELYQYKLLILLPPYTYHTITAKSQKKIKIFFRPLPASTRTVFLGLFGHQQVILPRGP